MDDGRAGGGQDAPDPLVAARREAAVRAMARRLGVTAGEPARGRHVQGLDRTRPASGGNHPLPHATHIEPSDIAAPAVGEPVSQLSSQFSTSSIAAMATRIASGGARMITRWLDWTIAAGARADVPRRWQRAGVGDRAAGMLDATAFHGDALAAAAWRRTASGAGALHRRASSQADRVRNAAKARRQTPGSVDTDTVPAPLPDVPVMHDRVDQRGVAKGALPGNALPLFIAADQSPTAASGQHRLPLSDDVPAITRKGADSLTPAGPSSGRQHSRPGAAPAGDGGIPRWRRMIDTPPFAWGVAFGVAAMLIPTALAMWQRSSPDRAATEAIVRDLVAREPTLVTDALQAQGSEDTRRALSAVRAQVETPFAGGWAGNPSGDVTLVMFSDYGCGFCRRASEDVERLLRSDKQLKVVWRELPILSEDSIAAARIALVAARQGRYPAFHRAMFAAGAPTPAAVEAAARAAGLDLGEGARTVTRAEADREFADNVAAARALGFQGTPAWVVGDQTLNGAVGFDALRDAITAARKASD